MTENTTSKDSVPELGRREFLKKSLVWGSAGATALALGPVAAIEEAQGSERRGKHVVYDVACLGETFRVIFVPGAPDSGDLRGSTFSVEGLIYPAGTIEDGGFDPESAEAIGRWFCRGWLLISPERPEPLNLTTQEYVLGEIKEKRLFPPDQLVSSGMEGSADEDQPAVRSVVGGTGKYLGARGVVRQHLNGSNTTTLAGIGEPAPNFRFVFRLV